MQYLIQVYIYTAALLLVYMLLLRNRPLYAFSRFYLLAAAVLPFLIPFISLPATVTAPFQKAALLQFTLPEITIGANPSPGFLNILWPIYAAITILVLAYHGWGIYRLWQLIRAHKKEQHEGYILIKDSGYGPGSIGNYILFPDSEINDAILAHEKAHIQLHHTYDILFLNLLQAFAWPMLLLSWIKKELKELHEFQADAMANTDKNAYAQLLVSSVLNTNSLPIMHSFIIHPLKRRIMMLQKSSSPARRRLTGFITMSLSLMLLGTLALAQATHQKGNTQKKSSYYSRTVTGTSCLYNGRQNAGTPF